MKKNGRGGHKIDGYLSWVIDTMKFIILLLPVFFKIFRNKKKMF